MVVKPTRSSRYIGAYVPANVVHPGVTADEKTLVQVLSTMNRNETVIACCLANVAVSGHSDADPKPQHEQMVREWLPQGAVDLITLPYRQV